MSRKFIKIGQKFGDLQVVTKLQFINGNTKWVCQCNLCGETICRTAAGLNRGKITSCGCNNGKAYKKEDLTQLELSQLKLIIHSRSEELRVDPVVQHEAIDVIVRDREIKDMYCHGGTELI